MRRAILCAVVMVVGMCFGLPALAGAPPKAGQFYVGLGFGEGALNNDFYIYAFEAAARQPEMAPEQSSRYEGPAYTLYGGRVLTVKETSLWGSSVLSVGVQAGYTYLGKYTITAEYANGFPSGYRTVEESAADLLLTSALHWEDGVNLFAKAGVARLRGRYEQEGLRSPRQPDYDPPKETHTYVAYRPEIVFGLGYALSERVDVHVQYASILGPKPETAATRFSDESMVELPNTLYAAGALTLGTTFRW